MKLGKKGIIASVGILGVVLATMPLLGSDNQVFLIWWLMTLVLGTGFLPLTQVLFSSFTDKGWIFSKAIGIAISGFLTWALVCAGILKFHTTICIIVTAVAILLCWGIAWKCKVKVTLSVDQILGEEFLFLLIFLIWTYLAGFRPEAHGTEKFMDYGFMAAMMRSDTLPATDIWYSMKPTNYYYGGQYFAVFLTKLTKTQVADTYNLMRTLVAGLLFSMSYSVAYQLVIHMPGEFQKKRKNKLALAGGMLSAAAVVFAGNFHYVIYGLAGKLLNLQLGANYWFPNSTRYIGYNPENQDKCIHEYPCYSFVLGDLHAHVVNTMFVIVVVGLLLAWILRIRKEEAKSAEFSWKSSLLEPAVLLGGFFIGLFQFTNYWDYIIYYTVLLIVIVYVQIYRFGRNWKPMLLTILQQAAEAFILANVTALPFTLTFQTMVSGVALAQNHTLPHQWLVLWGLPVILLLIFTAAILIKYKKGFLHSSNSSDLFVFLIGMCGLGLVLIPEFVYVRDIYEDGYARSNTMFKLTYQAFIFFGLMMGYVVIRLITWQRRKLPKLIGGIGLIALTATFGYFGNAVYSWFGPVWKTEEYRCLDATRYLENVFPEDAGAIRWLNENISGTPTVLEANGDSYSDFERVSAMTGLPTVMGWYVHEWLWRGDTNDLNDKMGEIKTIYTGGEEAASLLKQYHVQYIFVGAREYEKYPDLNLEKLLSLGEVVYESTWSGDVANTTYVIKVNAEQ
ncbi:MAG: DUF2298 domain-containing protein [Lachnospiraceae bacterium]|nr:DUF2298 domain-containing protein [Lachnospiraceae bacterium]